MLPLKVVADLLFVALTLAALGLGVHVVIDPPRAPATAATPSRARAVFIGGWLTAGGEASVAAAAAQSLEWDAYVVDHPGAGLVRGGSDGSAPLAREVLADLAGRSADMVVVAAGQIDLRRTPADVALAAAHLVDRLRVTVPVSTALVLVAPDGSAGPQVRAALAQVAREKYVHFLDPASGPVPSPGAVATPERSVEDEAAALATYLKPLVSAR